MEGDYLTKEYYDLLIQKEDNPMFKLIFRLMGEAGLRVGEVVGTSIENPNKKLRKKQRWIKSLPGMLYSDIDKQSAKELGYPCEHTIHIHRKRHKEEDIPLPDELFNAIIDYANKANKAKKYATNKDDERIFPTHRSSVHVRLQQRAKELGIKGIHAHSLRRFFGRYEHMVKGTPLQVIQAVYGHEKLQMTLHYLRLGRTEGLRIWASSFNK